MNSVYYNQALSTFSPVLVAGALAMYSMPTIAQQQIVDQGIKSIWGAAYCGGSNISTYSHLSSSFAGQYGYAAMQLERRWLTSDVAEFLRHSSQMSLGSLDSLISALRECYGDVQIDAVMHTDPEEGWTKPIFIVHSGLTDFDELMDIEDGFFARAAGDATLLAILPFVVVSQAQHGL